jgi:hypothetical protein
MREERSSAAVPPGQRYRPKQSIEEVLHARAYRWESVGAASRDSLPNIREAGTRSVSPGRCETLLPPVLPALSPDTRQTTFR